MTAKVYTRRGFLKVAGCTAAAFALGGGLTRAVQGMFAIRQGPWKLIDGLGFGGFTAPARVQPTPGGPQGQLYNLQDDPGEQKNLWLEKPEIVERLTALLERYQQQGYSRPM